MNIKRSKLPKKTRKKLIEHFVGGTTARTAAELIDVNRNTARLFYQRLRELIAAKQDANKPFDGEIEIDESYFGGKRKGLRGRGAAGKVPVFGILKRGGSVYAQVIPDVSLDTLFPIIRNKIVPDSIVYSDSLKTYENLSIVGFKHKRINHSKTFAEKRNHINGIENFWNQAKRHLRKFNGIPKKHFHLFLKECEWRFNNPSPRNQLNLLIKWVERSYK